MEIKFRGIAEDNVPKYSGQIIYGKGYLNSDIGHLVYHEKSNFFISVKPETVGQFTGYYDIHGTEIYSNDILRIVYKDLIDRKIPVSWENGRYQGLILLNMKDGAIIHTDNHFCEVVGNKFEYNSEDYQ